MKHKVISIFFILVLAILSIANLLSPQKTYSETENRYLAQFPDFSFSALRDGSYTKDIENFVTDQFLFRDQFVSLKTISELALQKKQSGGVYFGKDGYLIEAFGDGKPQQFAKNLEYLANFSGRCKQQLGILPWVMLVPTAADILTQKLPKFAPEDNQQNLLLQAKMALPNFVWVQTTLKEHQAEDLYYKTDHHWTMNGAYLSYCAFAQNLGLSPTPLSHYTQRTLSTQFFGTTYSKASLYWAKPDTMQLYTHGNYTVQYANDPTVYTDMVTQKYLSTKDKYSAYLNGNQPLCTISTDKQTKRTLLLIKDSYGNSFAPFATADFEKIVMVDLRYYKADIYELCKSEQITDILVLYNLKGFCEDKSLSVLNQ